MRSSKRGTNRTARAPKRNKALFQEGLGFCSFTFRRGKEKWCAGGLHWEPEAMFLVIISHHPIGSKKRRSDLNKERDGREKQDKDFAVSRGGPSFRSPTKEKRLSLDKGGVK